MTPALERPDPDGTVSLPPQVSQLAGWPAPWAGQTPTELMERFDSLIAYVQTWADGGNSDGFADTLRAVRAALAAAPVTDAGLREAAQAVYYHAAANWQPMDGEWQLFYRLLADLSAALSRQAEKETA